MIAFDRDRGFGNLGREAARNQADAGAGRRKRSRIDRVVHIGEIGRPGGLERGDAREFAMAVSALGEACPRDLRDLPQRQRLDLRKEGRFCHRKSDWWRRSDAASLEPVTEADDVQHEQGIGRFAWLSDPEGNRIELWEPDRTKFGAR